MGIFPFNFLSRAEYLHQCAISQHEQLPGGTILISVAGLEIFGPKALWNMTRNTEHPYIPANPPPSL